MNKLLLTALAASAAFVASPSQAALTLVSSCATVGLDDITPNADACVGYYNKNELTSNAGDNASADEVTALNLLGLFGTTANPIKTLEKLTNSGNFVTPLNGTTYIGVHYGNGQGPIPDNPGGVTAFYRFNAGKNLDAFTFQFGSVSGVTLYSTGPAVPEPAAWAMMIGGFGIAGMATRRRRRTTVTFA